MRYNFQPDDVIDAAIYVTGDTRDDFELEIKRPARKGEIGCGTHAIAALQHFSSIGFPSIGNHIGRKWIRTWERWDREWMPLPVHTRSIYLDNVLSTLRRMGVPEPPETSEGGNVIQRVCDVVGVGPEECRRVLSLREDPRDELMPFASLALANTFAENNIGLVATCRHLNYSAHTTVYKSLVFRLPELMTRDEQTEFLESIDIEPQFTRGPYSRKRTRVRKKGWVE